MAGTSDAPRTMTFRGCYLRGAYFILCGLVILAIQMDGTPRSGSASRDLFAWFFTICLALAMLRLLGARLQVSDEMVSYRGLFRSWTLPRTEIRSAHMVELRDLRPNPRSIEFTTTSNKVLKALMIGYFSDAAYSKALLQFSELTGIDVIPESP